MIVNYLVSNKTRAPFCGMHCCGNKFGLFERSQYANRRQGNRMIRMRRYAKRAEQNVIRKMIRDCLADLPIQ